MSEQEELFSMHENPNPACQVGRNIQSSLDHVFLSAQRAMEAELASITMEQVSQEVASKA
jgi:DNA-binding IscR family transcriptional regulator